MRETTYDMLRVYIAETQDELGVAAAEEFATATKKLLLERPEIAVVIALGAAQRAFFPALIARNDIEWHRISVLQIDVYMGVADEDRRSGGARLREHLLDHVTPKAFYPMHGDASPVDAELARYTAIYQALNPVLCVVGIGETGHLGFIDPPADFETSSLTVAVALSEVTRRQIEKTGRFTSLDDIPRYGISLTVPALMKAPYVIALADEAGKAGAIAQALEGPVTVMSPASILRRKENAQLFLSVEAAAGLLGRKQISSGS